MTARIQMQKEAKRGEVIRIRILIQHPMETGFRLDTDMKKVAKNVIRSFVCRYNGAEVFRAELSPGIAANPYLQFATVADASGEFEFSWVDDTGARDAVRESIQVA
ncbi:MAG TPA: thiosulfate oxidation carrier complex protein SoxZ [Burkholderiales bacterium]